MRMSLGNIKTLLKMKETLSENKVYEQVSGLLYLYAAFVLTF